MGSLRIVKTGSNRTKNEAKAKLKEGLRDYEDGLAIAPSGYGVKAAIGEWLRYGLWAGGARRSQARQWRALGRAIAWLREQPRWARACVRQD